MSGPGGMCRSPFGKRWVGDKWVGDELHEAHWESNRRLDKTDELLKEIMNGDTDPHFAVFAAPFLKAIHNYKYGFMGDNKVTDVKWQDAHTYLFVARSTDQSTWGSRRLVYTEDLDNGKRITHRLTLSDEEMRLRCFDVHYSLLRLDLVCPIGRFLSMLETERRSVILTNRAQIEDFIGVEKSRELCRQYPGSHIPLHFTVQELLSTLTRPESIRQLEELLFFPAPDPTRRIEARAMRTRCPLPTLQRRMKSAQNQTRFPEFAV